MLRPYGLRLVTTCYLLYLGEHELLRKIISEGSSGLDDIFLCPNRRQLRKGAITSRVFSVHILSELLFSCWLDAARWLWAGGEGQPSFCAVASFATCLSVKKGIS
ncbi:hypothetical protein CRV24_003052 [Beauveria bassiana]|nr:hypothetical protein CRV24_003052 [Beauveria bassiana]